MKCVWGCGSVFAPFGAVCSYHVKKSAKSLQTAQNGDVQDSVLQVGRIVYPLPCSHPAGWRYGTDDVVEAGALAAVKEGTAS